MLVLVSIIEDVLRLASEGVQHSAHCVRMASHAWIFPVKTRLTPGGRLVLDQPFLDQTVSRRLKDVQCGRLDAAFEKATLLFAVFGKFGLLLKKQNIKPFVTETYVFCTLFETLCVVLWIDVFPVPRVATDIGKSVGIFPSLAHASFTLCKVLQHLRVLPVVKVVVILELLNFFHFLLTESPPVGMHLIGLPFLRVFVTVRNEASVVQILVHVLHAVKQLTSRHLILLVFQL